MRKLIVVAAIAIASISDLAGCHHRPTPMAAAPPPPPTVPEAPPPPPPPADVVGPTAYVESEEEQFLRKSLDDLNAERPLQHVYFDLDSVTLRVDALDALQANARWLSRWTTTKISIEGHCDERGTAEYNLALGERRSAAVRRYLESLGVTPDRVLATSKGKEEPACSAHNEACWQLNRRGHFVITAK